MKSTNTILICSYNTSQSERRKDVENGFQQSLVLFHTFDLYIKSILLNIMLATPYDLSIFFC